MEQECADALNQVFSADGVLWMQAHQDIEAYRAQHYGSGMDSAHLINDDGEESPLTGVSLRQGPGVLLQKPSLEAESADRIDNNQEPFQEDILQSPGTCVLKSDMEVEQLTDFREANISDNEGDDERAAAQHDQSSDLKSVSDVEDDWGGSLDENQDSLSDRSDLLEELEDLEAQNLLEEEGLEADDQGICVDDQEIADVSDEDAGEAETMPIGSPLRTHQKNCQNEISFVGGTSKKYPQLVVEEYGSTYKKPRPITNVEEHTECSLSTHHDSQSKVPSFATREQEIKLTSICDSGECLSSAKNYKRSGYEEVSLMARKSQLFSFLDEEDTIMSVKRDDEKTGTDGMILIHENAGKIVSLHQQPQQEYPGNPTNRSSALAGAEAPCDVLGSAVTPLNGHLVQESSEDVLLNQLPFPGCSEKAEEKYEVMQQDDFMTLDIPVSSEITVHEERFDFGAEQIDAKVSDQSEVQSLSSQDEVHQANSETKEDLDIEDNQGHQHGGRLFHAESIYCPPGARNYEYRLDDSYDSSEDKVEAREYMVDRGRDISDKLDPEILHLLELHLLKQQLVVIEEEEEEEEENDFDGFHVNAHKLHFENFGPSKKMGHLLDMVLEEPELLEEKEEEEDELKEVHLEHKTSPNDDLDEETHSCEEEITNRDFAEAHCEDVDITATFADLGREESDRILQITLQPVVGTEISFVEELGFCKEEEGHSQQDLDDYYHSDCDIDHKEAHIASRKTNIALKNGLDEHESLKTPRNGDQLSKPDVPISQALELDNRLQRKNEDTFNYHQPKTDIVTEIDSPLCSAFYHELDISNTKSSVKKQILDGSQTTDTNNIICFENVPKSCSLRELGLTAECIELASEHVGWPLEMSGEKALVVPGTFTQNHMTNVRYPKPTTLKHLTKESPSYYDMKKHLSQQNPANPLPRADIPELLEAEHEHANSENTTEAVRHEVNKLQKDHLKRKQVRVQSSTAIDKCSREKIKTPLVAVDTYNEKGPDVYTQLVEALEWAQASEQRNSELQGELEKLGLRCDALCQEKAELVTLLKKREAELNSLRIQREGWMLCGDQEAIAGEATKIHSEAQIETLETTQEASPLDTAECYKGSKQTYRQTIMQKEFDLLRQESRTMVEQLNSLQEELRAQNHSRKPSSFLRHLFRTGLVAALGIILFWWGTKQLG